VRSCRAAALMTIMLMVGSMAHRQPFRIASLERRRRNARSCSSARRRSHKRKLMPALTAGVRSQAGRGFAVVGISRTGMTDEQFREKIGSPSKSSAKTRNG